MPSIEDRRRLKSAREHRYLQNLRIRILAHYSEGMMECACCFEDEIDFLTIDHIQNNGAEHRRKLKDGGTRAGGTGFYRWLIKHRFPPGFQILCSNCNTSKAKTGICIHKRQEIA